MNKLNTGAQKKLFAQLKDITQKAKTKSYTIRS